MGSDLSEIGVRNRSHYLIQFEMTQGAHCVRRVLGKGDFGEFTYIAGQTKLLLHKVETESIREWNLKKSNKFFGMFYDGQATAFRNQFKDSIDIIWADQICPEKKLARLAPEYSVTLPRAFVHGTLTVKLTEVDAVEISLP